MSDGSLSYKALSNLLARYVALAGVAPDDTFSEQEQRWIRAALTKRERELAVRHWTPTQPTATRRIRAFLVFYSEHSWSRAEIAAATRDPINTVCSALHRLLTKRLVAKVSYGRFAALLERRRTA